MSIDDLHRHPLPGTPEYDEHVREEIEHYGRVYDDDKARETLMQPVPPSWTEVEIRCAALIRAQTGNDEVGHVAERLAGRDGARLLSLGCGPGGVEIVLAQHAPTASFVCVDLNPDLLKLGRQRAAELALNVEFTAADLNTVDLPRAEFDIVFCHAALHHVIELERLAEQMRCALKAGGVFITTDVITRNGYLMWPETREVVDVIWRTLPAKFRLNHLAYSAPLIDDQIWEADTSLSGMECARSGDILPAIDACFAIEHFVPYMSLSRRFFDAMYGPNYDLTAPLDRAVFDWIWQLDRHYLESGRLRPESFFGIYRPL